MRDISGYMIYKDTDNKQKKMEEPADKLGFVQIFLFLPATSFCIVSSLLLPRLLFCTTDKSAMLQITVCEEGIVGYLDEIPILHAYFNSILLNIRSHK